MPVADGEEAALNCLCAAVTPLSGIAYLALLRSAAIFRRGEPTF